MRKINKKNRKKRKIILRIILIGIIVILLGVGIFWNRYFNKNQLIEEFSGKDNQEVFLLGSFHENHFDKWVNYSMEDLLSAVENINPDAVFIEAREDMFLEYGVVDGPIDMAVIYSYCLEHEIDVEMVDWWEVTNDFETSTTNDMRDDHIFQNIESKLALLKKDQRVLVVCGAGHFYEQRKRFLDHHFESIKIKNRGRLFDQANENFKYPEGVEEVWEARAYFYAYTFPQIVKQDKTLNEEIIAGFDTNEEQAKNFYRQQVWYCGLFDKDELYK